GYSGVSLLIRKELVASDPVYSHPPFDFESRMVQVELGRLVIATVYVPNGGKDYPAKLNFLTRLTDWARQLHAEGRELLLCGDINIARTEMDVHPKERKPDAIGQRAEERALFAALLGTGLADLGRQERGQGVRTRPIGNLRTRFPVPAKTALHTAGAMGGSPASPTPLGGASLGTRCTSISGISASASIR